MGMKRLTVWTTTPLAPDAWFNYEQVLPSVKYELFEDLDPEAYERLMEHCRVARHTHQAAADNYFSSTIDKFFKEQVLDKGVCTFVAPTATKSVMFFFKMSRNRRVGWAAGTPWY